MKTTIKKSIALLVFCFTAMAFNDVKAQTEPTFEQTVDYIIKNTKGRVMYPGALDSYSRVKGYVLKDVKIDKTGRIELFTDQKFDDNKFSINFNIFDLVQKVDYPDGIRAYKFLVHFNGLNVSSGYGITFATDADAQKIARAFRHLRQVCTPENDLFSQIPAEEKKIKLTREETIDYINKLIRFDRPLYHLYAFGKGSRSEKTSFYTIYKNLLLSYDNSTKSYMFKYSSNGFSSSYEGGTRYLEEEIHYDKIKFSNYQNIEIVKRDDSYRGGNVSEMARVNFSSDNYSVPYFFIYFPLNSDSATPMGTMENLYGKELKKLSKAFERLKELDSDEKDPFED